MQEALQQRIEEKKRHYVLPVKWLAKLVERRDKQNVRGEKSNIKKRSSTHCIERTPREIREEHQ